MENSNWGNEIVTTEMIKKYAKEIVEESCGNITDPEHQTVVMTEYDFINYLQGEHETEYLEGYGDLWDEDGELDEAAYEERFEEIWNADNVGEHQEGATDYSGMTTFTIKFGDGYYFVGNIEELWDESLLEYATWHYDEE